MQSPGFEPAATVYKCIGERGGGGGGGGGNSLWAVSHLLQLWPDMQHRVGWQCTCQVGSMTQVCGD